MFPLITALVAGDIFASEDHNGTLKTVLTRSLERWQIFAGKALAAATYARDRDLHLGNGGGDRRLPRVGLQLGADAVGDDRLRSQGPRARVPEPARLPDPDRDGGVHRPAALDDHAQQCGRGRGDADGLAAVPADRHPARAWRAPALPAEHPVQRLAGAAAPADRLGADRPRRLGVRDVCRAGARRRHSSCSCAATSPVADRDRVLVVDDDPPLRRMLARTLAAEGYDVTVAADGGAALAGGRARRARRDRA